MTVAGRSAAETLASLYTAWVDRSRIITVNVWSSELAKLVANSMLAQRLSSINSISAICEATGAEINEVSAAIGSDVRLGNKFLRAGSLSHNIMSTRLFSTNGSNHAGIGFGGSCFKKDVLSLVYLAESLGLFEVSDYWRSVVEMNEYQRNRFSTRVIRRLNSTLVTKKLTILGYAFKKNTSDTRETPALEIIKTLLDENPREIAIYDPCVNQSVITREIREMQSYGPLLKEDGGCISVYSDPYEATDGTNAILIITDFDEFKTKPVVPPSLPSSDLVVGVTDALRERFVAEPDCAADCPDCHTGTGYIDPSAEYKPKKQLDWKRIASHIKSPGWVFDGRCILDVQEMKKLGIRVESIGSAGGL